jgi:signal transduction histidine kinase
MTQASPAGGAQDRGPGARRGDPGIVTAGTVDLMGILTASQALSSETSLDRLQQRVVEVLSAMTGATGVRLIPWSEERERWWLSSEGDHGGVCPGEERSVPTSVLRHVRRTYERLVVRDAAADHRFARDPYFAELHSCSLLAVPVFSRGRLRAVLLLENRLVQGAFSAERLDAVNLIAGQLAVSLDNAQLYAGFRLMADEQAALRRVAMLVAKEAPSSEVFAKVAEEAATTIGGVDCALARDEGDGTITALGAFGEGMLGTIGIGERFPVDGTSIVARVLQHGRPCRIDDYSTTTGTIAERGRQHGIRSAAGCPIVVGGRTWGAIAIAKYDPTRIPPEAERRIAQFAELAATAIVNAAARAEVERLVEEQAALRRVATLVAQGAAPTAVFEAAAAEMATLLKADGITLCRYEPGGEVTVLAHRGPEAAQIPPGTRVRHDGRSVSATVRRTHRPARLDSYSESGGAIGQVIQGLRFRSGVGAPIILDGRLWGVAVANWVGDTVSPPDTEERVAQFTQLLETALANADSRDQLTASRVRLLTEADSARRRVVRDLHDGTQQRLVHTIVTLKLAQRALQRDSAEAASLIAAAIEHAQRGNAELRELAHGMLPTALTKGGIASGVQTIVARLELPVVVDLPTERYSAEIEASTYFIISEALTNVVKHSQASAAEVRVGTVDGVLRVEVRDNGTGGADATGHGLVGINDRVIALGGRLRVESPAGGGTRLVATLPLNA